MNIITKLHPETNVPIRELIVESAEAHLKAVGNKVGTYNFKFPYLGQLLPFIMTVHFVAGDGVFQVEDTYYIDIENEYFN